MVAKLHQLPQEVRDAVTLAACAGNVVDVATFSRISGLPEGAAQARLWETVREGLMRRDGHSYRFVHDRIQQAAYSLVPEAQRAEIHLRVARLLIAHTPAEKIDEHIFDIVSQLALSSSLIANPDERLETAQLFLRAARKAKASTAYQIAVDYLATGESLLERDSWDAQYDLTYGLCLAKAECEWLIGDFRDAERSLQVLLSQTRTRVEQLTVYGLKSSFT